MRPRLCTDPADSALCTGQVTSFQRRDVHAEWFVAPALSRGEATPVAPLQADSGRPELASLVLPFCGEWVDRGLGSRRSLREPLGATCRGLSSSAVSGSPFARKESGPPAVPAWAVGPAARRAAPPCGARASARARWRGLTLFSYYPYPPGAAQRARSHGFSRGLTRYGSGRISLSGCKMRNFLWRDSALASWVNLHGRSKHNTTTHTHIQRPTCRH